MKHKLFFIFFLFTLHLFSQNKNQSIGFKENKGQIIDQKGKPNTKVKYLLNSNGLNVQLKKNGFSYDVYEVKKTPHRQTPKTAKILPYRIPEKDNEEKPEFDLEYTFHRIDIDFVNSNSKVKLITEQKSTDFDNYYNVPNKPEGITGVYQFKQITYKNIYPDIDVVFTIPNDPKKVVEYNFIIHPKGKISDIQLKFNGAETDLVDNKIQMNVRFGKMEETLPASWIEEGNSKKEIAVGYRKIKKDVYGFDSTDPVNGKTIVIDPVPTRLWGTYYGEGISNDFADIGSDSDGNIYFTGYTISTSSIYATAGAHQTAVGDASSMQSDIIIAKFDKLGKRIWSTFYGGESWDRVHALKIDKQNNIIIVGQTMSSKNIATPNSFKPAIDYNSTDAFVTKFNSSGIRIWGTYFGTGGTDVAADVDTDANNNIYVVGNTNSYSGISTNNTFQTLLNQMGTISNSSNDGFMIKFNPNGNILWGTYIGGESLDYIETIKISSNYLVLGGKTMSKNYISTPGTFQENPFPLGTSNYIGGTVYKFTLDGNRIWSTYYGARNRIETIEIDDEDSVYIGGTVSSSDTGDNIATPGSFDDYKIWTEAGFLAKLNSNGQRMWGTYLGKSSIIYSIIFKNNSLYLGGMGGDNTITTPCTYKRNGFAEGYIGKFTKSGQLLFGTYVNGFDQYSKNKICFENNNIIIGGQTAQDDRITDSNSYQQNINGRSNFYLMGFSEESTCNINANPTSNSPVCIGDILNFKAESGYNYSWTGPNTFTSTLQNPSIINVSSLYNGTYHLKASDNCGCEKNYDIEVVIGDIQAPTPDTTTLPTITGDCNTTITIIPTATDVCMGSITGSTTSPLSFSLPGNYTIIWDYNDGNGNISHQNQVVTITNQPLPSANSPQTFCIDKNANLNNIQISGQDIKWYNTQTAGTLLSNTTLLQNGVTYYATQTINGCESERIPVTVNIQNTTAPTGDANQPFCTELNATISSIQITGQNIKWYNAANNGSSLVETTSLKDGKTYYASQTVNNCEGPRFGVTVFSVNMPSAPTATTGQAFCKKENKTLNDIQITGQNIKWYDTGFSAAALPSTTLLENNRTYYASQTTGCESDRTPILVKIHNTPLPTGNNNQQFCIDEIATIEDLAITGTALKWYDSAINGNILQETTLLKNQTYYVTQTLNNCESERLAIIVKIQDTQKPIAESRQTFCFQQNASIKDINIIGQNIKWFESNTSTVALLESTPLKNGMTYYASQTIANCESDRISVAINILEATNQNCIHLVDEIPFPKFFTPNNDGYNDTWTIDFGYLAPNTVIQIFDRYGKFIKEITKDAFWDGTYLGRNEPTSDYWFTATRSNGKEFRGHFSLKR